MAHVDLVAIFTCGAESDPFTETARGIDLGHAERDSFPNTSRFLDESQHDATPDPLPLEAAVQVKLAEKYPLLCEAFALPGHIQVQRLDDPAYAFKVEAFAEGEVPGARQGEG